jgi:pimeloyl-ACP methyl ester carboxylesterase
VLVHGAPDRSSAFRRSLRHLTDLHTVVYDRRGYGGSSRLEPAASLVDHAQDLIAVLDGRRAIVVGHSFGGNVALHAATLRPELVAAVAVWEPSNCWLPEWPPDHTQEVRDLAYVDDPEELGEQMARRLLGASGWDRLDHEGRALRRAEGLAFSLDMRFLLQPPFDLTQVEAPAMVGVGGETTGPHLVGAHLLAAALDTEPTLVPACGHLVHMQAPEIWAGFVRNAVALA